MASRFERVRFIDHRPIFGSPEADFIVLPQSEQIMLAKQKLSVLQSRLNIAIDKKTKYDLNNKIKSFSMVLDDLINRNYSIVRIDAENLGVKASRNISKGDLIICEGYILSSRGDVTPDPNGPENFITFLGLKNVDDTSKIASRMLSRIDLEKSTKINWLADEYACVMDGVFKTNARPLDIRDTARGVFPTISRINHSCCGNSHFSYSETQMRGNVFATQDIAEGEEILISYTGIHWGYKERRLYLQKTYKFVCRCQTCSRDKAGIKESESNRSKLDACFKLIKNHIVDPNGALRAIEDVLPLLDAEPGGFYSKAPQAFIALLICARLNDFNNALKWVRMAHEFYTISEGASSDNALKCKNLIKTYTMLTEHCTLE